MSQQRYKVIEKIAAGGMAEVFRAESAGLEGFKKTVAIKRVLPHLSEKKQFINMFLDEARLSARLSHSNCVQVFDIGVGDNAYFIVMEYVDGADLKAIAEHHKSNGNPIPVEEACLIGVRICEGLTYAHEMTDSDGKELNIVHRDVSPPNVLITRHGEVKIVDFGLAKANSQLEDSEPGIIKGKFSYLSPEAAVGKPVDSRSDIFAVGIILWELLAGKRLFMGKSDLETVQQIQKAVIPSLRKENPAVSADAEQVIFRALAKDPEQRFQTARELGQELNRLLFSVGRSVSSFDIAKWVEPVWRERTRRRKPMEMAGKSFISNLIDETLFEFTSLNQGAQRSRSHSGPLAGPHGGAAPLNLDSFVGNLDSVSRGAGQINQEPKPSARYEAGNLAALEEDARPPATATSPLAASPLSLSLSSESTVLGVERGKILGPQPEKPKGNLILLLVCFAIGVAVAYFIGARQ